MRGNPYFSINSKFGKNKQVSLISLWEHKYDGAQITDLVGLMILQNLKEKIPEIDFALYRDDGLGIYENLPSSHIERIKKK